MQQPSTLARSMHSNKLPSWEAQILIAECSVVALRAYSSVAFVRGAIVHMSFSSRCQV